MTLELVACYDSEQFGLTELRSVVSYTSSCGSHPVLLKNDTELAGLLPTMSNVCHMPDDMNPQNEIELVIQRLFVY